MKIVSILSAAVLLSVIFGRADAQSAEKQAAENFSSTYDQDLSAFKQLRGNLFRLSGQIAQCTDLFGPKQQMDLIFFCDGDEPRNIAVESDLSEFRRSWKRPKWHILIQYAPSDQPDSQK